ncbi:MAG: homocysteine S-methyltransferase family protein [Polyangiaceae bacterium]|nr:homocysteine S-methyltransferase family protein [Polyangiaceae bacterium]
MAAPETTSGRPPAVRPVLVSADPVATLRARGVPLHPVAPIGRLLRESPADAQAVYEAEVEAGVDVLFALTAGTAPRSLAPIGMAFRAAALTGAAVDLALEASAAVSRRVAVAGVLGGFGSAAPTGDTDRLAEDYAIHATRLAAAGCEILVASGFPAALEATLPPGVARLARRAAVVSASATQLATWALFHVEGAGRTPDGEAIEDAVRAALDGGADTILIEAPSVELALTALARLDQPRDDGQVGVLLCAGHGEEGGQDAWVTSARRLFEAGARILGGGAGSTVAHLAALAKSLRENRRLSVWRRA